MIIPPLQFLNQLFIVSCRGFVQQRGSFFSLKDYQKLRDIQINQDTTGQLSKAYSFGTLALN